MWIPLDLYQDTLNPTFSPHKTQMILAFDRRVSREYFHLTFYIGTCTCMPYSNIFSPHYLLKCRKSLKNQWRMWKHVTVRRGSFSTYITFNFHMRLRRKNTAHNENYNDYRIAKLLSVLNRVVCDAGTLNTWWIFYIIHIYSSKSYYLKDGQIFFSK